MDKKTLFLFDVDGVLLDPHGYKDALIDTTNYFALRFGQQRADLQSEEIAFFESLGITNEWLSGAIILCEYVRLISEKMPSVVSANLELTGQKVKDSGLQIARPDFKLAVKSAIDGAGSEINETPDIVLNNVLRMTAPIAHHLIEEILGDVRPPAPFSDIFQMHTLGSEAYQDTYRKKAVGNIPAYLETRDISNLSNNSVTLLRNLKNSKNHDLAIYTARPSLPPADLNERERKAVVAYEHPPEGDLVKKLVGLEEDIPLISGGRMSWLALSDGRHPGDYIKPSPVHGLATIAAAYSQKERDALTSASALWRGDIETPIFQGLRQHRAEIFVYEDSPSGIYAIRKAAEYLKSRGFQIDTQAIGIAQSPTKRARLSEVCDVVFEDINEALSVTACL